MKSTEKLANECKALLNLETAKLSKAYYYSSLPLCVVDAVFSIGVNYQSTMNAVERFADYVNIAIYRDFDSAYLKVDTQYTISDYLAFTSDKTPEHLSEKVFENKQRTSTRNGILKSRAVNEFMEILKSYEVNVFQDLKKIFNRSDFEREIRGIKGQSSGLSLNYFYMLSGNDQFSKPDRMVLRFIKNAIGENVDVNNASRLIKDAAEQLKNEYPEITPRLLDHAIWNYQRSQ